jgi:hypothetical protein
MPVAILVVIMTIRRMLMLWALGVTRVTPVLRVIGSNKLRAKGKG